MPPVEKRPLPRTIPASWPSNLGAEDRSVAAFPTPGIAAIDVSRPSGSAAGTTSRGRKTFPTGSRRLVPVPWNTVIDTGVVVRPDDQRAAQEATLRGSGTSRRKLILRMMMGFLLLGAVAAVALAVTVVVWTNVRKASAPVSAVVVDQSQQSSTELAQTGSPLQPAVESTDSAQAADTSGGVATSMEISTSLSSSGFSMAPALPSAPSPLSTPSAPTPVTSLLLITSGAVPPQAGSTSLLAGPVTRTSIATSATALSFTTAATSRTNAVAAASAAATLLPTTRPAPPLSTAAAPVSTVKTTSTTILTVPVQPSRTTSPTPPPAPPLTPEEPLPWYCYLVPFFC